MVNNEERYNKTAIKWDDTTNEKTSSKYWKIKILLSVSFLIWK